MRKLIVFCFIFIFLPIVNAVCLIPSENLEVKENAVFCYGINNIESGIKVISNNIIVDCNNSALIGSGIGYGILLKNKNNIIVQNCNISNYEIGIYLDNTNNSVIKSNYIANNKFGIALFNSFNNDVNNNVLVDNTASNAINYLPASLIQETELIKPEEKLTTPHQMMEEVIKIKKPFLDKEQIIDEVDSIFNRYFNITQQNLEIIRTFFYNESDKSTNIILHLKPKKILLNVSIYEKIPKCVSAYASQILFETAGYEVIQDDPLILWTFQRLDNDKELTYKVLRNIDEECKNLLFAFGIATGFEEFEKAGRKEEKNNDYFFIIIVVAVLLAFVAYLKIKRKISP